MQDLYTEQRARIERLLERKGLRATTPFITSLVHNQATSCGMDR